MLLIRTSDFFYYRTPDCVGRRGVLFAPWPESRAYELRPSESVSELIFPVAPKLHFCIRVWTTDRSERSERSRVAMQDQRAAKGEKPEHKFQSKWAELPKEHFFLCNKVIH